MVEKEGGLGRKTRKEGGREGESDRGRGGEGERHGDGERQGGRKTGREIDNK